MAERDDWDTHWRHYAESASKNPAQVMRHELVVRLLTQLAGTAPMRLLDIGSGQGDLLAQVHARLPAASILGLELSTSGVEISREKVPGAEFLVADLLNPTPELDRYRGWATHAVCSEVLEHLDSPADFLRVAGASLAAGAHIVVTVPGGPMSAFDRHIGHRQHFTRESISKVLRDGGFDVERVYLSGFPFFNLYRCVVIARGEKLADDITDGGSGVNGAVGRAVMAAFRGLFRMNLSDSPFGWQVVVVARKAG